MSFQVYINSKAGQSHPSLLTLRAGLIQRCGEMTYRKTACGKPIYSMDELFLGVCLARTLDRPFFGEG
jgi:hypothetical protein